MKNADKYTRGYFMPPVESLKWTKKEYIDKAPVWCSVDLRDGNQALIIPMSLEEKLEFFKHLVRIGFKEIEIGFPAASDTEYEFCRRLIEDNLIPDDVAIQVLTQSREHIIKRTFEALAGAKNAIVHLYNSTSVAQREQVFRKSRQEIIDIAVTGAKLLSEYREKTPGNFRFEYSPESFTGTEMDFALDICNAVIDVWKPTPDDKVIINLPVTVQVSMPHVYASQIEYMCDNLNRRDSLLVSLHPHNDRGCGVADSEMGLLAGADRIEGTLFGNGERTGNVDIVTLAMNLYTHGIDPGLDFTDIPALVEVYERVTRMKVYERTPYSGALVFAAFSGSHQDAIAKGMKWRDEKAPDHWTVPYLPIDPKDIGREYEGDVIRINSQSGKGGISYILEQQFGYNLPAKMREDFGYAVKRVSDQAHKELLPDEILSIFKATYLNKKTPLEVVEAHYIQQPDEQITAFVTAKLTPDGKVITHQADGNGRLAAVANAVANALGKDINIVTYQEHALEKGSKSRAAAYVGIETGGKVFWGAGTHTDIIMASVNALISAVNNITE
ncbi:MAG: 2-isopropylmalate synthase [Oscillospiraceae bacterium]